MVDSNQKPVNRQQQSDSDAWSQSTKRNPTPIDTLYRKDMLKEPVTACVEGMFCTKPLANPT
jgi:hypothetical protein